MSIGTKSILFGAHQFLLHPLFVAWAWWELYSFPFDPRLWLAFFVHDLGYFGKPNMDGQEGERHVEFGARIMGRLFGNKWREFCLYHSRFYAKRDGKQFSQLCVADKYAFVLTPKWLYLPMVKASGEIYEYMDLAKERTGRGEPKYASMKISTDDFDAWYNDVEEYLRRWVVEHKDGREDTWTPAENSAGNFIEEICGCDNPDHESDHLLDCDDCGWSTEIRNCNNCDAEWFADYCQCHLPDDQRSEYGIEPHLHTG